jgi:hypothetical protein
VAAQRAAEGESTYSFNIAVLLVTSDAAIDLLVDRRKKSAQVLMLLKNVCLPKLCLMRVQSPDVRHDARGAVHVNVSTVQVKAARSHKLTALNFFPSRSPLKPKSSTYRTL